jgi:NADPH-dependent curcumin reductase CurA
MSTLPSTHKQWRLASYPEGLPVEDNWSLSEGAVPAPGPNQMLVRAIYLDVAPYMRGRISPQKNYAAGVKPGDVMLGGGIGEVVQSNTKHYKPGDIVVTDFGFGWQEYAVLQPSAVRKVDPALAPLPYWMEAFGLNGVTAYFALLDAAPMKAGDTVVISAAAGSVGQIAGQIAKLGGCRAVGITSSPEKAASCRELGYDDIVDYRAQAHDLPAAIAKACPGGVDVYIDNTAGAISDAVMQNLAPHARIVLVGSISLAGRFGQPDIGPRFHRQTLIARATIRGFLVSDYLPRYQEARDRLVGWYRSGALKSKFDFAQGIESLPKAFLRLLNSENVGKQLVQVGADPTAASGLL